MKALLIILIITYSSILFGQKEMYDICPIKNSENLPSAIIYDRTGEKLDIKTYIGKKPVVMVFYRGGWCPFCMRHLSALAEIKPQIDSLGFELIAITPDDYTHLNITKEKMNKLGYQLFSDKDVNAINAFGIGWKINDELYIKYKDAYNMDTEWWTGSQHHILPVPAVFIINNGKIQHQYVNPDYSKRLSPGVLLSFLKETQS